MSNVLKITTLFSVGFCIGSSIADYVQAKRIERLKAKNQEFEKSIKENVETMSKIINDIDS